MSTVELIEQWLEKCDLAHQAQTRYDRDPTPTNYFGGRHHSRTGAQCIR